MAKGRTSAARATLKRPTNRALYCLLAYQLCDTKGCEREAIIGKPREGGLYTYYCHNHMAH